MKNYILVGRTKDGDTVYWTGKAGLTWVSFHASDAFQAPKELASTRAMEFNALESRHGVWFLVSEIKESV